MPQNTLNLVHVLWLAGSLTALMRIADLGTDARRPLGAKKVGEIAR